MDIAGIIRCMAVEIEADILHEMLRFISYRPYVKFENFVKENPSYPRTILAITHRVIEHMAGHWGYRATLTVKDAKVILTFSDKEIYKQTLQEIVSTGIGGQFGFADERPEITLTVPSYLAIYPVIDEE